MNRGAQNAFTPINPNALGIAHPLDAGRNASDSRRRRPLILKLSDSDYITLLRSDALGARLGVLTDDLGTNHEARSVFFASIETSV